MATIQNLVGSIAYGLTIQNKLSLSSYVFDAGGATAAVEDDYPSFIVCDPGGSSITLTLPAESEGRFFIIANSANAAENITVKDDTGATTVATVAQNEMCIVVCDGTDWYSLVGGIT